ncbi:MAG: hypothetical protein AB7N65_28240 [Vicinamibacterales bacterium]
MRRCFRVSTLTLPVLGLVLGWERPVHAYIDPGSGSLIYQAILAAVLGVGFTFRRVLGAVLHLGRGSSRPETSATRPDEATDAAAHHHESRPS